MAQSVGVYIGRRNERIETLPFTVWLGPTRHRAHFHTRVDLGQGTELLASADGEQHEDPLTVALIPNLI